MVAQPDQQELTFEERVKIQRERDIECALAAGNPELAEFLRTVEYEEVSPEEREELSLLLERVRRQPAPEPQSLDEFMDEWRAEDPEFVAMLDRCDEQFPGWSKLMFRLPADHPGDFKMLRNLDRHEPEASEFLRGIHDDLRSS